MPAALRKKLGLRPGQPLLWKMISDTECRVVVVRKPAERRGQSARGYMKRFQKGMPDTTSGFMELLREGEHD
jgi:bifunctional DNA-binding transcriptional regulator/antitoxin component of YhaV-PrlF toxin-antitoxin module